MDILLKSEPFILLLVLGCYLLGSFFYKKTKIALMHPVIISMLIIILFLNITDISYKEFSKASWLINFMLGPAVVSLGVVIYEQSKYLKENLMSMLISITIGSIIGSGIVILLRS